MKKKKLCPNCHKNLIWPQTKQCKECYKKGLDRKSKSCIRCGLLLTEYNTYKASSGWRNNTCKQCVSKYQKNRYRAGYGDRQKADRQELKRRVMEHYGGACVCCGVTDLVFLAIDHINGGGSRHKKQVGGAGHTMYTWLENNNFPSGFQVLCHNCNFAKHKFGVCPHASS